MIAPSSFRMSRPPHQPLGHSYAPSPSTMAETQSYHAASGPGLARADVFPQPVQLPPLAIPHYAPHGSPRSDYQRSPPLSQSLPSIHSGPGSAAASKITAPILFWAGSAAGTSCYRLIRTRLLTLGFRVLSAQLTDRGQMSKVQAARHMKPYEKYEDARSHHTRSRILHRWSRTARATVPFPFADFILSVILLARPATIDQAALRQPARHRSRSSLTSCRIREPPPPRIAPRRRRRLRRHRRWTCRTCHSHSCLERCP